MEIISRDTGMMREGIPSTPTKSTERVITCSTGAQTCPAGLVIVRVANSRCIGFRFWDGLLTTLDRTVDHGWITLEIAFLAEPSPSVEFVL
jgi:hypothetical protein